MKKRILDFSITLALFLGSVIPACAVDLTFTDVPARAWYAVWVEQAAAKGWISGVGGGKFEPNAAVTYSQFAVMLDKALFAGDLAAQPAGAQWWTAACEVADQHGLFTDTDMADRANWNAVAGTPIEREQMAQMMYDALIDVGAKLPSYEEYSEVALEIGDIIDTDNYDAVAVCYALKLIAGNGNGYFDPHDPMTRAQAAVVLCNVHGHVTGTTVRPAGALGGHYDTTQYDVPADANKDGWITQSEVDALIAQLKVRYPEDTLWNDAAIWGTDRSNASKDGYISTVGDPWPEGTNGVHYYGSRVMGGGYGCAAWAFLVSDRIFGDLPKREIRDVDLLNTGDVIGYTMPPSPHWSVFMATYGEGEVVFRTSDSGSSIDSDIGWSGGGGVYAELQHDLDTHSGGAVVYTRYPYYPAEESTLPDREKDLTVVYPEWRCDFCGFLFQAADRREFNFDHGDYATPCEKCGRWACAQCVEAGRLKEHERTCQG